MKTASSMWADMLGLGPLLAQINDPTFQGELRGFVQSQIETRDRVRHCETLLVLIADHLGIEHAERSAALPLDLGTAGAGGAAVASRAPDNGAGGNAAGAGPARRLASAAGG